MIIASKGIFYIHLLHTVIAMRKGGLEMEAQRAQEIMNSPKMVTVTHNGTSVYIEHVDQQQGTATVHPLDNPDEKQNVSVSSLQER